MDITKSAALALIIISASISGCLSSDEKELEEFPSFSLSDEQGNVHNNSNYSGTPFIAYFSASWCSHCYPVLGDLDDTIPARQLIVFNKEPREEYSDMNEWKDKMESELERDLVHPFIHAPTLSQSLEVSKIPTVFFVNSDGEILHRTSGLTDESVLTEYWETVA